MEILIASHNHHKIKEFRQLFEPMLIDVVSLSDIDEFDEVVESGKTFLENALLKAEYFCKKHHRITIGDDSGLVIEALDGDPGVNSSRYSGKGDKKNNEKVLKLMEGKKNRKAAFVCVIALILPDGKTYHVEGVVEGLITHSPRGNNGFGYDPIFLHEPYGKTFAELHPDLKNKVSHRALALQKLKELFYEVVNN